MWIPSIAAGCDSPVAHDEARVEDCLFWSFPCISLMCEAELGDSPLCGFCCLSGPSCWEPHGASWCYHVLPYRPLLGTLLTQKAREKNSQAISGWYYQQKYFYQYSNMSWHVAAGPKNEQSSGEASGGSNGNDPQGHYRASGGRLRDPDSSKRRSYELDQLKSRSRKWNRRKYLVTTLGALSAFQFHMHSLGSGGGLHLEAWHLTGHSVQVIDSMSPSYQWRSQCQTIFVNFWSERLHAHRQQ